MFTVMISDAFLDTPEHRSLTADAKYLLVELLPWCAAHGTLVVPRSVLVAEFGPPTRTVEELDAAVERLLAAPLARRWHVAEALELHSPHIILTRDMESRMYGVYHLFAHGTLVYVGMGKSPDTRIREHVRVWPDIDSVAVEWFATRREAAAQESHAIRLWQPVGNTAGTKDD